MTAGYLAATLAVTVRYLTVIAGVTVRYLTVTTGVTVRYLAVTPGVAARSLPSSPYNPLYSRKLAPAYPPASLPGRHGVFQSMPFLLRHERWVHQIIPKLCDS